MALNIKTSRGYDYKRADFLNALKALGVKKDETIFSHSNLAYFGVPAGSMTSENIKTIFLDSILDTIGSKGTFVVPTFSYTFPNKGVFDIEKTPSVCGVLTEIVRGHPQAYRSEEPIFSVAALGAKARELTQKVSYECFGKNTFWDRFYENDGLILNFNFGVAVTFFHYIERSLNVPYRYNKLFFIHTRKNGFIECRPTVYFCRDLTNELLESEWLGIDKIAQERGLSHAVKMGRGYITSVGARDLYKLVQELLEKDTYFLTKARDVANKPSLQSAKRHFDLKISQPSIDKTIGALSRIPRDMVCDGYDACLQALTDQIPFKIYDIPTGVQSGEWIVPEKWTCYEGYLAKSDGQEIFSYDQGPSCIASYSQSFDGIVEREELLKHIWTDPLSKDDVPSAFLYYDSNWGFCLSRFLSEKFTDSQYRVVIKSDLSYGSLKIAEAAVKGKKGDTIILISHLTDQKRFKDGLLSTHLGIRIFKKLKEGNTNLSYCFIILPQSFHLPLYLNLLSDKSHIFGGLLFDGIGSMPYALAIPKGGHADFVSKTVNAFKEFNPEGKIEELLIRLNAGFEHKSLYWTESEIPIVSLSGPESSETEKFVSHLLDKWETCS